MNTPNQSPEPQNNQDEPRSENFFLRILITILAVLVMPLVELARNLSRRVYSGWVGLFHGLFAVLLGTIGSVSISYQVGWTSGYPALAWLPAGILGFFAVILYVYPILHLYVFHPLTTTAEKLVKWSTSFARTRLEPLSQSFQKLLSFLPGAGSLWERLNQRAGRSWFINLLTVISYVAMIALGITYGYKTWAALKPVTDLIVPYIPMVGSFVSVLVSLSVAFTVFYLICDIINDFIKYGKHTLISCLISIGITITYAGKLAAATGYASLLATTSLGSVLFILLNAYTFPILSLLITDGFKQIVEWLKPTWEKTYESAGGSSFYEITRHVGGAVFGAFTFHFIAWFAGILTLPVLASNILAVLLASVAYTKYVGSQGYNSNARHNVYFGSMTAVYLAYLTFNALLLSHNVVISLGSAALGGLFGYWLIFPVLYILLDSIVPELVAKYPAKAMTAVHAILKSGWDNVFKNLELLHNQIYDSNTKQEFKTLLLHVINIMAAIGVFFVGSAFSPASGIAATVGHVALALLSYVLVGKILLSLRLYLLGVFTWLGAAYASWSTVMAVSGNIGAALLAALVAGSLMEGIVLPVAFAVLAGVSDLLLTPWLTPLLSRVYEIVWDGFSQFWNLFLTIYKQVRRIFAPIFNLMSKIWNAIMVVWKPIAALYISVLSSARRLWESMFGKK